VGGDLGKSVYREERGEGVCSICTLSTYEVLSWKLLPQTRVKLSKIMRSIYNEPNRCMDWEKTLVRGFFLDWGSCIFNMDSDQIAYVYVCKRGGVQVCVWQCHYATALATTRASVTGSLNKRKWSGCYFVSFVSWLKGGDWREYGLDDCGCAGVIWLFLSLSLSQSLFLFCRFGCTQVCKIVATSCRLQCWLNL